MKKVFIFIFLALFMLKPVRAEAVDYRDEINSLTDNYGVDREIAASLSFADIVNYIKETVKEKIREPYILTLKLLGIVFICSIAGTFSTEKSNNVTEAADVLCTFMMFVTLLQPFEKMSLMISENLTAVKDFMSAFIPLYAAIATASGEILTSAVYSGMFLSGLIFTANFCISAVLPSLKAYYALIIANSVSMHIRLKSVCEFYIKSVKWIMRTIVSVICFFITLQTTVSRGNDNLAVKAGKLLAGSAIPVVGSALQDAVGSVYAGMESIKGFAGAAGTVTVVSIFLPSVVTIFLYWFSLNLLYMVSDMFDTAILSGCIKSFIDITELLLSVVILFIVLFVLSSTIMIGLTNG